MFLGLCIECGLEHEIIAKSVNEPCVYKELDVPVWPLKEKPSDEWTDSPKETADD